MPEHGSPEKPQRITAYLTRDRARLHALLERATASAVIDDGAFASFREGLLRHIAIEEKILFPAAQRAHTDEPLGRARDLRVEHAALTSLLVPTPDLALCREIGSLLTEHDQREEGVDGVYAACEQRLSEEESAELTRRAVSLAPIRVAPHFDGPRAHRTAADALAAARRTKPER